MPILFLISFLMKKNVIPPASSKTPDYSKSAGEVRGREQPPKSQDLWHPVSHCPTPRECGIVPPLSRKTPAIPRLRARELPLTALLALGGGIACRAALGYPSPPI
jgi:hypothetical protein